VELKGLKVFSEILNGKSLRSRRFHSRLFAIVLSLIMRGRRAFLNDSLKERIPWDRLKYIVGPTYAQNEFEIQVDLSRFNINCGDAISIQFNGSDQLSAPVAFTFSQPVPPKNLIQFLV
jgi:hypothetical protein